MPDFLSRGRGRSRWSGKTSSSGGGADSGTSNQAATDALGLSGPGLAETIAAGTILREGATGAAVVELQARLGVPETASFDAATKAAVERFQQAHSLGVDGAVGPSTLAALDRVEGELASAPAGSEILFQVTTTGASTATASQDGLSGGVAASETMAETDRERILAMKDAFQTAADRHGLPPALLAAIASRETRGGNLLDSEGYSRYDPNGFGVMQVDKRYHELQGTARSEEHIEQAAEILADYRDQVRDRFPDWTEAMVLRGAVAAYNTGPGDVRSWSGIDSRTTGDDYSSDVWARARAYASIFGDSLPNA